MAFWRTYDRIAELVDRRWRWYRLPRVLGLATLVGVRNTLRRENLYDTGPASGTPDTPPGPPTPEQLSSRTVDGTYNDLSKPRMGMAGSRFGRNVPLTKAFPEPAARIMTPSPREVSRTLMTRAELIPATSVNALVAAWLQFMIRDWFSHGPHTSADPWVIPLADDDPWPDKPMLVMRTPPDPQPAGSTHPPAYLNTLTHWWDASQIYGTSREYQQFVRSGEHGKLRIDADGTPPMPTGDQDPAREPGFWLGLLMLQSLFTREHNAICDMLVASYPDWTDEELFQRARLILAALIAKIHTVEWTPAVINNPTTVTAMHANWWGLAGEKISRVAGRISDSEVISGIPGGHTDHFGVPYSLTEEFAAVYRMHPMMPDDFDMRSIRDDRGHGTYTLRDLSGPAAIGLIGKIGHTDLLYSFGTMHPGLVTLHNFPRWLQEFRRPDGRLADLAATDIMRDRELGVPRYNEFRRLLHLPAPATFAELTDNPVWAREIARVYHGEIERVDLQVGLYAEKRPAGFAFSDTAFRIFIVMASRRLNSDRFLTKDFTPAVYTPEGLRWIADNTMSTVLLRHHPELRAAMRDAENAFQPWSKVRDIPQ
ncbi:putative peroxidase [Actinoplanes ianthinogenes]|uniref:Peroxidase n=1 Tax=Actinoplanes ianthinogenes TaxID=122358 RepID=A0ABM7LNT8_9ACTN|nr:peroxidase family protein [Actinoplanes ianthinogenes]BCJ40921.1 putative peroxidase [Actinoplanes ianthinogenes]GGR24214.1 putative peroxidase [Actinoplanes ianthinogenes]